MAQQKNSSMRNLLLGTAAAAGAGVLALSAWTKKNEFQSPLFLARYLSKPHSLVGPLFDTNTLRHADAPMPASVKLKPIEQVVDWKGVHSGITSVLRDTETNSLMVAKDGVIVHKWFRDGFDEATLQSSWSVAKSVVGIVTGQLIAEGKLSEDTKLVDVLPEYATGGPFDQITVGHLLDMKSGIDLPEVYSELGAYTGVGGMMTTKNLPAYLMKSRNTFALAGEVCDYRSVDTQFLSMIVSRIDGKTLAASVRSRVWDPMGAEDSATWTLDRAGGIEKGFMGLNASPRDFLKLGQLVIDKGRAGDNQVIPQEFLERMLTLRGIVDSEAHNWGYSSKWWHPSGSDEHTDITALGVYGQFVYVNLTHNVVIAKQSDHGAEQDEDELISVFRQLSANL